MSELDKPKRPFFQIHLLTAVILSIAAGPILFGYARFLNYMSQSPEHWKNVSSEFPQFAFFFFTYMLSGPAILFLTWFSCEWFIRRREARKP